MIENIKAQTRVVAGYDSQTNMIISSFRGSINLINLVEDFVFMKTAYPSCFECYVHEGFLLAYNSLSDQIIPYVTMLKSKYPTAEVIVTGHSLGAAEAILGALD